MAITTDGVLTFTTAINYEDKPDLYEEYDGSTYDFTATVTATDASGNATNKQIVVTVLNDPNDDVGYAGNGTQRPTTQN